MKLTPQQFLDLLERADAVSVDDGPILTSWGISNAEGEDTNEIAAFSWTDGDYEYWYKITEKAVHEGHFDKNGVFVTSETIENETNIRFYTLNRISPNL